MIHGNNQMIDLRNARIYSEAPDGLGSRCKFQHGLSWCWSSERESGVKQYGYKNCSFKP